MDTLKIMYAYVLLKAPTSNLSCLHFAGGKFDLLSVDESANFLPHNGGKCSDFSLIHFD